MSAPITTAYPASPIPKGDDDNSQHHSGDDDDDFPVEDGDDDDDLGLDEINDGQAPAPHHNLHPGVAMCIICHQRPAFSKGGKSYPTCGLNCARILESGQTIPPSSVRRTQGGRARGYLNPNISRLLSHLSGGRVGEGPPGYQQVPPEASPSTQQHHSPQAQRQHRPRPPPAPVRKCVVCLDKPCSDRNYVTCSLACAEKLCKGGVNSSMCNYCHRRRKLVGQEQCGQACSDSAKIACLLCKSRPKFGRYHLCGKSCKQLATKSTPLLLEAPPGHATFELVEKKFQSSWKNAACPPVKKIYKIIENQSFLTPYDKYKQQVGNEVFRYHGTKRTCKLGSPGNTQPCSQTGCALCSILRTSFKVSLARSTGAFGAGVYSSSASSMAFGYGAAAGGLILCKVVLGKIHNVASSGGVKSCPSGFNSVEYGQNGAWNQTMVYTDDAIRPVFLIVF